MRRIFCVNRLPQVSHLKGFRPLWSDRWNMKTLLSSKLALHRRHWYGGRPVAWAFRCSSRASADEKGALHNLQIGNNIRNSRGVDDIFFIKQLYGI